ncbi:MAG: M23 family metallopeptidase [Bacteroidota bacterium]
MARGDSFECAFSKLKDEFKLEEVRSIEQNYLKYHPHPQWVGTLRRAGSIAAMLVFIVVAGVDAQKRPDISPVFEKYIISSSFGEHLHPVTHKEVHHHGIDLKVPMNTSIRATADGTVKAIRNSPKGHGLYIVISHNDGFETLYANLNNVLVETGQTVLKGEEIAMSGRSGMATAPHLHYEIRQYEKPVNPELYISK